MRGNGWYSNGFLSYVHQQDIKFDITHQLLASFTYPSNYLLPFFNEVIKYDDFKFIANGTIGSMARAKKEHMNCFYETSFDTAAIQFFDLNPEKFGPEIIANSGKYKKSGMGGNTSVKISPVDPDKTLWKVCLKKEFNVLENDIFMWNQILENEYVLMYELRQKMGGTLVEIKTDCVICEADDAEATLARFELDETIIGGLKEALPTLLSSEILPQTNDVQKLPNGTPDYITVEEKDFEDGFPVIVEHI
jgi:hypothetical protein